MTYIYVHEFISKVDFCCCYLDKREQDFALVFEEKTEIILLKWDMMLSGPLSKDY